MALLPTKLIPKAPRRATMRGAVQTDVSQGKIRIRKWPQKRGKPPTQAARDNLEKFSQAQRACKFMAPQIVQKFTDATANTPLLPRDLLTSILYNRLAAFVLDDGKVIWPMPAMIDVSQALDTLGATTGGLLARGSQYWYQFTSDELQPQQSHVYRTGNTAGATGSFSRVPYNAILSDPLNRWSGAPNYQFTVERTGFYLFELNIRKTTNVLNQARLLDGSTLSNIITGFDVPNSRSVTVSSMIFLTAGQSVTSGGSSSSAGTYEAAGTAFNFFRCTGPFPVFPMPPA